MAVEDQTSPETTETNGGSKYIIFKRIPNDDRNVWEELGEVVAAGAYAAREQAIEKFDLMEDIRRGDLEMVSLGARFWIKKQPKVNVSESVDVG
jgi:hypothetical protein